MSLLAWIVVGGVQMTAIALVGSVTLPVHDGPGAAPVAADVEPPGVAGAS